MWQSCSPPPPPRPRRKKKEKKRCTYLKRHCFNISVILGKSHYLLYHLVAAMQPRMLVTFDEELRPLPVAVRVGQVGNLNTVVFF